MEDVKTITIHTNVYVTQDILAKTVNVIDVMLRLVQTMVLVKMDKLTICVSVTLVIWDVIVNTPTAL